MGRALEAVGRACARRRGLVLAAWLLLVAGALAVLGTVGLATSTDVRVTGSGSSAAQDLLASADPAQQAATSPLVFTAPPADGVGSATLDDPDLQAAVRAAVRDVALLPTVASAPDPFADPRAGLVSADRRTAYAPVRLHAGGAQLTPGVAQAVLDTARAEADGAGVAVQVGGPVGEVLSQPPPRTFAIAAGVAVGAALVVLLLGLGGVVAALVALAAGLTAGVVALAALAGTARLLDVPLAAPALTAGAALLAGTLLGFATVRSHVRGVRPGLDPPLAAANALRAVGRPALVATGVLVVALAAVGALLVPSTAAYAMAVALGVVAAVLAALTLLPALLGLAGRRATALELPRWLHRRPQGEHTGAAAGWARLVTGHRTLAGVVGLALLVPLALPLLSLRVGPPDPAAAPESTTQRQADDALRAAFGPGATGPLLVAVSLDPPAQTDPAYVAQTELVSATIPSLQAKRDALARLGADLAARQKALDAAQSELEQEIAQLAAAQTDLDEQQQALDSRSGELASEQTGLDAEASTLAQEQAALEGEATTLRSEQQSLEQQELSSREQLAAVEQQRADAVAERADLRAQRAELADEREALPGQIDELATEAEGVQDRIDELEALRSEVPEGSERYVFLTGRIEARTAQLDDIRSTRESAIAELRAIPGRDSALRADIRDLSATITDLAGQAATLERAADDLAAQANELSTEADTVQGDADTVRAESDSLLEQAAALQAQADELAQESSALQDEGIALQTQATELNTRAAALAQEGTDLATRGTQLATQEGDVQAEEAQLQALQARLAEALATAGGSVRATDPRLVTLQRALGGAEGVQSVSAPAVDRPGTTVTFRVVPQTGPAAPETALLVERLRTAVLPPALEPGVEAQVGGPTAAQVDLAQRVEQRLPYALGGALLVLLLVLGLALRAVLVPLVALVGALVAGAAVAGAITAGVVYGWALPVLAPRTGLQSVPVESDAAALAAAVVLGLAVGLVALLALAARGHVAHAGDDRRTAVRRALADAAPVLLAAAVTVVGLAGAALVLGGVLPTQLAGAAVVPVLVVVLAGLLPVPALLAALRRPGGAVDRVAVPEDGAGATIVGTAPTPAVAPADVTPPADVTAWAPPADASSTEPVAAPAPEPEPVVEPAPEPAVEPVTEPVASARQGVARRLLRLPTRSGGRDRPADRPRPPGPYRHS